MFRFALALVCSLTIFDAGAASTAMSRSRSLRVLSYNVKGLPDVVTKMDSDRFRDIGRILAERRKLGTAPDIVLIQEAFIGRTRELVVESGYPFFAKGPNATDVTETGRVQPNVYGSGLYILSEFPISESKKVTYDLRFCAEADCGSNKGAQMVALDVPGLPRPLKIFNTHAQANRKHDALRTRQYEIFSRFIANNLSDEPFVVGGDFNSRPGDLAFGTWEMLTSTVATGGYCVANSAICRIDPATDISKAYRDAVDHIFFAMKPAASGISVRPTSLARNFAEPVDGRVLSDHLGYEAEFEVTWSD